MRWKLGLLVAALAAAGVARAQEDRPSGWIADPRSGCQVWNNFPQEDERIEWTGPCVDGYAHGRGTLRWFQKDENYETQEGELRGGKLNGWVFSKDDEGTFEGEFRDNLPNGEGTRRLKDGEVYSGRWRDGCFDQGGRRAVYFTTLEKCGFPPPGRSI